MVFAEFTALVQSQWLLLRDAFGAEGHKRRVQQRQDKKQAKQQQKAARRAARQARKALRKQPPATIIVEPAEPPKSHYRRPEILSVPIGPAGLAWAQTTEALEQVSVNDSARFFKSEPCDGEGRDAPRPLQDASPECVGAGAEVAKRPSSAVATATEVLSELALELQSQLEQKQREFYDSLGGYSTVDEEEDELHELHEQLAAARGICETKLPANWTVVGIKKAVVTQPAEAGGFKLPEALEEEEDEHDNTSPAGPAASTSNRRAKTLSSSEELVETEPEDDGVDLRDSDAFDGYSTFDEEEAQELFIADHEFDGLCAPRSSSPTTAVDTEYTAALEAKIDPTWAETEPEQEVEIEEKEEFVADKLIEINLNDDKLPEVSYLLDENEPKGPPMLQTYVDADDEVPEVSEPSAFNGKLLEEMGETEYEEEVEIFEVVEEVTEVEVVRGVVEVVEEEVVVVEDVEDSLQSADEDMFGQLTSLPPTPQQTPLPQCCATPGVYSPGSVDEYACAIYENLRVREHRYHVTEDIFVNQKSVTPKMRSVLVDWIVEVHQRFELEEQTLYLTVNYIDRYLAQAPVKSQCFQLVGVAALLIASKFEEIYPCDMDDLLYICERSYSKADLIDCERSLLNVFKFNLAVPSASSFLGYYLDHFEEDELIGQLANYFSECSLLDFTFGATYEPSVVACACLLSAYCYVENQTPALVWNFRLVELTGYAVEAILPCAQDLWSILIQPNDLTAVPTKYSAKEFGEVAHLPLEDLEALLG